MRPGKLRLVVLMQCNGAFSRANVSTGPPRQAAHDAFSVMCTPAPTSTSHTVSAPSRVRCSVRTISGVAGTPNVSTATRRPRTICANAVKSLVLPPVHDPMYARSSRTSPQSRAAARLAGSGCSATTGSSADRSSARR